MINNFISNLRTIGIATLVIDTIFIIFIIIITYILSYDIYDLVAESVLITEDKVDKYVDNKKTFKVYYDNNNSVNYYDGTVTIDIENNMIKFSNIRGTFKFTLDEPEKYIPMLIT